ncbi:MAG: hypothetical protein AAB365_00910 [Patescibacteria group bacterium]
MLATRELQLAPIPNTTALQNGQLVSRIFTDAAGHSFRLTFFVSIIDGEVKGQLVSAQEIGQKVSAATADHVFCLPFSCPKIVASTPYVSPFSSFVSPYFSLEFLINSQPTRAPSRA